MKKREIYYMEHVQEHKDGTLYIDTTLDHFDLEQGLEIEMVVLNKMIKGTVQKRDTHYFIKLTENEVFTIYPNTIILFKREIEEEDLDFEMPF